ncbi:dicarboxylic amino acid permease [Auriculariales sp. MPI-PUGE-AT-0066]|nr:dicarboxylic amino acid permease [Auriculariales sp. MPI-PUGE-AT-0066]
MSHLDDEKKAGVYDGSPSPSPSIKKNGANVVETENEDLQEVSELQSKDTLHRGLKARQVRPISMIALGGAVGTGLIIGSGTALQRGGPLGILIGYSFVGLVCYCCMIALGEMAAWLPHKKGFSGYATRFVDPAVGFALGWNYLLKYLIVTPNNINAAGVVIRYWTSSVHMAIWMSIFIVFIFVINLLGVRVFGELEFWFSSLKVLTLIGLLFMSIIIDLGGNPHHDRIGFRYWNPPDGPMGTYLEKKIGGEGALSRFLGFWAVMVNALFAYIGTELIGVTVGEAQNPRKNIPTAIRRTFWRILVFYVGGVFCVGLTVPSRNKELFSATQQKTGAAASPFVVAASLVGIKALPGLINACILIFVLSAANSDLYIGTRTLYALAIEGKAPSIFRRVNRWGVPLPALILCTVFCSLSYLNVAAGTAKVFGYFVNLVSTFGAITWMCIAVCHIRFMKVLKYHGIDRKTLPYMAPFQPYGSWFALIATAIITFFKGFDTLVGGFNRANFITSYIGLPTFFVCWAGYKLIKRTKVIPIDQVDLFTGKRVIDEEEEHFLAEEALKPPRTFLQRLWDGM